MAKIAIDNGHGINTAGKRTPAFPTNGKVIREWEFNYPTAKHLETIFKAQGHQVLMVSDTSDDTSRTTRAKRANDWGADVFVSVHYNAFKSMWGSHGGVETLYSTNSIDGKKLAELVQLELVKLTGLRDRGIKPRSDLAVLNATKMVAILPECGFMDNFQEASLMLNESYQIKCATAISNGINAYLGHPTAVKPVPPVTKPSSELYRVRKSWEDAKSQLGAYTQLDIAKKLVDARKDYQVYDSKGKLVYPERRETMKLEYKRALRKGMSGEDVKELQKALVLLGYDPKGVDGSFGGGCDTAVRLFQRHNGLSIDGSVGKATVSKINAVIAGDKVPVSSTRKSKAYYIGNALITETTTDNTDMKIVGNTLAKAKIIGTNANFFDRRDPNNPDSCWGIAVSNGKAIGGNSMLVSYDPTVRRGTIIGYTDGTVGLEIVNNMNQFSKKATWAVSGHSVYPKFNPSELTSDINYRTAHTYIAYKGKTIYTIVKPYHMIRDIMPLIKDMKLEGCIVVDGGLSSQTNHPDASYSSTRPINSAITMKEV